MGELSRCNRFEAASVHCCLLASIPVASCTLSLSCATVEPCSSEMFAGPVGPLSDDKDGHGGVSALV